MAKLWLIEIFKFFIYSLVSEKNRFHWWINFIYSIFCRFAHEKINLARCITGGGEKNLLLPIHRLSAIILVGFDCFTLGENLIITFRNGIVMVLRAHNLTVHVYPSVGVQITDSEKVCLTCPGYQIEVSVKNCCLKMLSDEIDPSLRVKKFV